MKRLLLAFLVLLPASALAQFTNVTGTVVDPNSIPYAFGTISATLVTSASPTLNGFAYTPPTQPTGLDINGKFTLRIADNTVLLPAATKWNFKVCSAVGTVNPAIGTGSQCFSLAAPITISGASQDISTQLNAAALALTLLVGGGGTTINPTNGVIPVRTNATTFGDSPLSVASGNVTDSGSFTTNGAPVAATFNTFTNTSQINSFLTATDTGAVNDVGVNNVTNVNPAGASAANFDGMSVNISTPAANAQNFSATISGYFCQNQIFGSGNYTYNGNGSAATCFFADTEARGSGTVTKLKGVESEAFNTGSGAVTNLYAFDAIPGVGGTATTTNDYAFHATTPAKQVGATMTHHYAFYADPGQTGGNSNADGWAFFVPNSSGGDRSQFGPTYLMTLALTDFAGGGSIGTAATTVDVYPSISITQTTSGQTLTLPSPTLATAGTILWINNTGSAAFTMLSSVVPAGVSISAIWTGSAWSIGGPSQVFTGALGTAGAPTYSFVGHTTTGMYFVPGSDIGFSVGGVEQVELSTSLIFSKLAYCTFAGNTCLTETAGLVNATGSDNPGYKGNFYQTTADCASSAAPAVCTSAPAGSVVIAAAGTTVTVNTTAVKANSEILLAADDTLGTKLSVTCNSTLATLVGGLAITARTGGTSFQITSGTTPAVNPLCINYWIVSN